jgi:hypothetical protein
VHRAQQRLRRAAVVLDPVRSQLVMQLLVHSDLVSRTSGRRPQARAPVSAPSRARRARADPRRSRAAG